MTALLVALGGAVGASLRYVVDHAVQRRHGSGFPWGTLAVNVAGSLLLGMVAAAATLGLPSDATTLLGVGLCGALTTFSTLGYETVRLLERGEVLQAVGNAAANLTAALGGCAAGFAGVQALL